MTSLSLPAFLLTVLALMSLSQGEEESQPCVLITRRDRTSTTIDVDEPSDIILYQTFCSERNFNICWTFDSSKCMAKHNESQPCEYTVDHCSVCHNASLILYDATSQDAGNYKVTAYNNCGSSNSTIFQVRFPDCNGSAPEPVTRNRTLVYAESNQQGRYLDLNITCHGDVDQDHYNDIWTNLTSHVCDDNSYSPEPHPKYKCERIVTPQQPCTFTSYLRIHDYNVKDSDTYCFQAYYVVSNSPAGRKSCFNLSIVPQPGGVAIDNNTKHIHLWTRHVSLQFKVTNYSPKFQQYINLTFLRDDEVIIHSQNGYSIHSSWPYPLESNIALVELQVPRNRPGSYVLHIDYASNVHTEHSGFKPHQIQLEVQSEWVCELVLVVVLFIGSIISIIVVCCCYCHRKRIGKKLKKIRLNCCFQDPEMSRLVSVIGDDVERDSAYGRRNYGAAGMLGEPDLAVDSPWNGVNSVLDMCAEDDIEDPELVKIGAEIKTIDLERLGILLLHKEERFRRIKYEHTSQGDHNAMNLGLAILSAWKKDTKPEELRRNLVKQLWTLKYYKLAKDVAAKKLSC